MNFETAKYHAVIFGDYQGITPDPALIQSLFTGLIQFQLIPGTTNNEVEILTGKMVSLLKFNTIDNQLTVTFRANGIHLEFIQIASKILPPVEDVVKIIKGVFIEIDKILPRLATRVSLVISRYCEDLSNINKDELYKRIFPQTSDIMPTLPYEWTHRLVSRYERMINKKREVFNNIITITRGFSYYSSNLTISNISQKGNRIELVGDLNTIPQNNTPRFNKQDIETFYSNSIDWHNELLQRTLEKINYKNE